MGRRKTTNHSPGPTLRMGRERLGRSLEDASSSLHIPLQQLTALEEDTSAAAFAAPVYAFGAMRAYAAWLGIPTRPLERQLARQLKAAHANRSQLNVHTLPPWYERFLTARIVLAAGGATLAAGIVGYVAWQINSFWRLPALRITTPTESVIEADRVIVAGQTEAGALVQVNKQPVVLRASGEFEQEVPLRPGVTRVQVEAANTAGRVRMVELNLLRPRNPGTVK